MPCFGCHYPDTTIDDLVVIHASHNLLASQHDKSITT